MKIERLNVGNVGVRYWGTQSGNVFALLPSPVDSDACLEKAGFTRFADSDLAWDEDFAQLTSNIVGALRRRYGEGELVAPRRVVQIPLWKRFKGLLAGYDPADLLNPAGLSAVEALLDAARDDSHLDFASVRFVERDRGHRCQRDDLVIRSCGFGWRWRRLTQRGRRSCARWRRTCLTRNDCSRGTS